MNDRRFYHAVVATITVALFMIAVGFANIGIANAHHVPVPDTISDQDAFDIARAEFDAQVAIASESLSLYASATSADEKATTGNIVETALTVGIDHMAGLDVRDCFALWHRAASDLFLFTADGLIASRSGTPNAYADSNAVYSVVTSPYFVTLFDCS